MLKDQGGFMKYSRKILTIAMAILLFIGSAAISASAQNRTGGRTVKRPVVVKRYVRVRPYYSRFWNPWYDSFYDPYFYDPYLREQRQRYYLERELSGNRRELQKHLAKYKADGVITAKEQRELDDDYKDVAKAERELREHYDGD
jgi:hypothetical protein